MASGCDTSAPYEFGSGPAHADEVVAERPTFTVGDEFWFDTGDGSIFVEVFSGTEDGLLVFRRDMEQETFYYSPDLALVEVRNPFESDERYKPDDGLLEFPLSIGKTWNRSFRVWRSDGERTVQRTRQCEVLDYGQAKVPAGSFASFRIECRVRELGRPSIVREEIVYAPAVGRVIARYSLDGSDVRLVEFSRAK